QPPQGGPAAPPLRRAPARRQGGGQRPLALLREPDPIQLLPIAVIHRNSSLPAAAAALLSPGPGGCSPGRDSGPAAPRSPSPGIPRSTAGRAPAGTWGA